jgi:hypothetical protein
MIASQSGHADEQRRWLSKAKSLSHLLLPSERDKLQNLEAWDAKQNAFSAPNSQITLPPGQNTARKTQPQPQTKT